MSLRGTKAFLTFQSSFVTNCSPLYAQYSNNSTIKVTIYYNLLITTILFYLKCSRIYLVDTLSYHFAGIH